MSRAKTTKQLPQSSLFRAMLVGFGLILVLMPLHGLFATVLGSVTGQVELFKAWKEFVLAALIIAMAVDMLRNEKQSRIFIADRLHQLIGAYAALHAMYVAVHSIAGEAELVGLTLNLRFLALFLVGRWLVLRAGKTEVFRKIAIGAILAITVNAVFGMFQILLLPNDFLRYLGYGPDTIQVSYTIDDNPDLPRVAGFTRGPNVLGGLLVIYAAYLMQQLLMWARKGADFAGANSVKLALFVLPFLITLVFTYSRSAWLAILAAAFVTVFVRFEASKNRNRLMAIQVGVVGASIIASLSFLSSSATLQTLLLHDDPTSGNISSTDKRFEANQEAFEDVLEMPNGSGVGSAGPASQYADEGPRIAENYYLQIAQEVGVVGLALFLGIITKVATRLWRARSQGQWQVALLASLVGLSIAALFGHTWADDEIALVWWGLAAMFMPRD